MQPSVRLSTFQLTYPPFRISFSHPFPRGTADFGSAIAIELRRGPPPDARDFLRFKFRNGTNEDFQTIHVFKHREDIPLTEFIYRLEGSVVNSNREWARACSTSSSTVQAALELIGLPESATTGNGAADAALGIVFTCVLFVALFFGLRFVRAKRSVRLSGPEVRVCMCVCVGHEVDEDGRPSTLGEPLLRPV